MIFLSNCGDQRFVHATLYKIPDTMFNIFEHLFMREPLVTFWSETMTNNEELNLKFYYHSGHSGFYFLMDIRK